MISPFAPVNCARLRAERLARLRRIGLDLGCLALLALIAVGMGHLVLTTALAVPHLAAQALTLKGM